MLVAQLASRFENMNNQLSILILVFARRTTRHRGARCCFCADMILVDLTLLVASMCAAWCLPSAQAPNGAKLNYPPIVKDSPERRARAEREWRRLLDVNGVPQAAPDLYPITYTPRSLLGVAGGIKIMAVKPEPGLETNALREAMKGFIDRWRELIGTEPSSISLVSSSQDGTAVRLTYRQSNFPLPIAGAYGEMVAVISLDGRLMQLDDRLIPSVDLALKPQVDRDAAARSIVGRSFDFTDVAGRHQTVRIARLDEVKVNQLVILPLEREGGIEIRLAWELKAGSSLTWTVFIDAMTGEQLRVTENFTT